jgi:predicted metalloprotease with PDZ domain
MPYLRAVIGLLVALFAGAGPAQCQTSEPIQYTVHFSAPHTHYAEIEARIPTGGQAEIELMMAAWTPGSYLIREYSRHVEDLRPSSADGRPLRLQKTRKNRWRIRTDGAATVTVAYRVYAREMSVRTNWVDGDFALLNGAATFLTLVETARRPHDVRLTLPPEWRTAVTGLAAHPSGESHAYRAPDFDALVDSPIVAGTPAVYEFDVDGRPHYLVNVGEAGVWDGPTSARDVERIVREHRRMWGFLPYDKYVFLNVLSEASGGLEHKNSSVIMASRWATRTRARYVSWLSTVSHEYFHTWNVKRLRPIELGPFDYENEVYTTALWMSEGFSDYFGNLALARAGVVTPDEFLAEESRTIQGLQTTPGRLVQPLELASYDTWIKYYRPDENSPNTSISYYTKGEVIAFLLDAKIRTLTAGARTLDDVMTLAYERYSGDQGFTSEQFRAAASEVAGVNLSDWFHRAINTTEEVDYTEALTWFGLRFKQEKPSQTAWLGLVTRVDNGRLLVSQVRRGTPGYTAGFNVDDEILAIGEFRVRADQWATRLEQYRPGDTIDILVARRERVTRIPATFEASPPENWTLERDPGATTDQQIHANTWMGLPASTP